MQSELATRIPEWENEADEYERKALALRQMVAAVRALNGDADALLLRRKFESHRTAFETRPLATGGPRGREAVLIVMGEQPEKLWKVVDVKREMLRRGWAPTPKAVEASLARLRERGEVRSPSYGYYQLADTVSDRNDADGTGVHTR